MKGNAIIQEVTTSLLAILAIIGTLAIISFQLVNVKPVQVPDIVIAYDFSIIAFYFGKVSAVNGARQAGTAAAQTAMNGAAALKEATTNGPSAPPVP